MMKRAIFSVVAALIATTAHSDELLGAYGGVLVGSANVKRDIDEDLTYKTDKVSVGAMLGWQVTQNFGLEASYVQPKKIRESATFEGDAYTLVGKLSGLTASFIVSLPVTDVVSFHARAGAVRAKENWSASINGSGAGSFSDTTTEPIYGGGIGFGMNGARLRIEYQRAKFDAGELGLASVSIAYFFGRKP